MAALAGVLLIIAAADLPDWADPHAPVHAGQTGTHYITQTYEETTVPNFVTAVLADYRGYDTMFETVVVFIAGLSIMTIVGMLPGWEGAPRDLSAQKIRYQWPQKDDPIVRMTCRLLMPIIVLFGLYVIAHGHHSPGGGFQGGIILGCSLIMIALAKDLYDGLQVMPPRRMLLLAALGVIIYSGVGVACLLLGENFLDYAILSEILPLTPEGARSMSMLWVEIGVAFTVSITMFSIYAHLSTNGRLKEGL